MLVKMDNILEVFGMSKSFESNNRDEIHALKDVSLCIRKGSTLGVVGESGSGKSTLARCILRLEEAQFGDIHFKGENLSWMTLEEVREKRKEMQMVFQDPYSSLNPRLTVGENIEEGMLIWKMGGQKQRLTKVRELMDLVGLSSRSLDSMPYQFSGGQQQRICIARALAVKPELLILDEVTSSLDVTVQKQILTLLKDLQNEFGLSYLFISHNLQIVRDFCDEVLLMHKGKVVEVSSTEEIFNFPLEPYTRKLISSLLKVPTSAEIRQKFNL
jgi:ABC-type glutathione transport system ATPase component